MAPNPPIIYTGPETLRVLFEEEYAKVADQFNRAQPRIHVGWADVDRSCYFPDQQALFDFVDAFVSRFQEYDDADIRGELEWEFFHQMAAVLKFQKVVSNEDNINEIAVHDSTRDTIFIEPGHAASYLLCREVFQAYEEGLPQDAFRDYDIPALLRHELVHNDIAESTLYQEVKRVWALRETDQGDIKRFGELSVIEKKLGIRLVNEACAYACWDDKLFYMQMLEDSDQLEQPGAMAVYDAIRKKVLDQGRKETIAEVRDTISKAYEEDRSCIELVLA